MADALLDIRNLRIRFGAQAAPVVDGIDLTLNAGEVLGVVGESGSGKSLSMLALMGLVDPPGQYRADALRFAGHELQGMPAGERRKLLGKDIAMVFQDPLNALDPSYSVGFQLVEVLRQHLGLKGDAARARALELLEQVEIPHAAQRLDAYPHQFSGGMAQRVAIALALAGEPRLLIADEPTTALDVTTQAQIMQLLLGLQRQRGMAMILISHDLALVSQSAQRVCVMRAGRIVEQGTGAEVLQRPTQPYTQALLAALPENSTPPAAKPASAEAAVLSAHELARDYAVSGGWFKPKGVIHALGGVSFELQAGRTLAVIGESGSGKSTLARLLTLIERPDSGELRIGELDIASADRAALRGLRRDVQMVFQNPYASLNPRQRIVTQLLEPLRLERSLSASEKCQRVMAMLERVGLRPEHAERYPHMFSGGQRQRIAIARAMMLRPKILIADEPTSALDVSIQAQVLELFRDLQREFGTAYVFITHNLAVVRQIADEVLVMHRGRAVEYGAVEQVCERPRHAYTQTLLAATPRLRG
jgi:ABC-type glutathione transport system ATPase component